MQRDENGILRTDGATLIDRTGRKMLPIGDDGFERAARQSVLVDKTGLIADVLGSGFSATLFCRPRRFGKTLNMTMMRAFFESAPLGAGNRELFEGTDIWEMQGGAYRAELGSSPVVYVSMRAAKGASWVDTLGALKSALSAEFARHDYLAHSPRLTDGDREYFSRMAYGKGTDDEYADSLIGLMRLLRKHHGSYVVVLIDEYDAPVMAGYSASDGGYYERVVAFLKRLLTGALKDGGEALRFACLTGVQRISKESIFSDLNNLVVDTALNVRFDERFGFTDDEVSALAAYLGHANCMPEARRWYDGYRFGEEHVYNPWSVLNYLSADCSPDVYWGNTSSNEVVGDLLRHAGGDVLSNVCRLLGPGGSVLAPLNLSVVFPDVGVRSGALWSMLYLAGYLTTDDVALPNNTRILRRLRVPNSEVAELYRTDIVGRFAAAAGGEDRLADFHRAVVAGDEGAVERELTRIARDSASAFDLTSENGLHMLVLGLLFGMPGYGDPESNREHGEGRPDIRVEPARVGLSYGAHLSYGGLPASGGWAEGAGWAASADCPLVTVELKFGRDASGEGLAALARAALRQIADRAYDEAGSCREAHGRVRWGIAVGKGRTIAARAERLR